MSMCVIACVMLSLMGIEKGSFFSLTFQDGGEMYFSDVYSNQALTKEIREHKVLWGTCNEKDQAALSFLKR